MPTKSQNCILERSSVKVKTRPAAHGWRRQVKKASCAATELLNHYTFHTQYVLLADHQLFPFPHLHYCFKHVLITDHQHRQILHQNHQNALYQLPAVCRHPRPRPHRTFRRLQLQMRYLQANNYLGDAHHRRQRALCAGRAFARVRARIPCPRCPP
jgi:hypothetical protein